MKEHGAEVENMPLEAPWNNGKVERLGALWKEVFRRTVYEVQLQGIHDMILATAVVTQCRN